MDTYIDEDWVNLEIKFERGCEVTTWDGTTGITGVVIDVCVEDKKIFFQIAKNDKLYKVPNGQIRCVTKTKEDILRIVMAE